jgi:uncharacterized membrane protein
MANKFFIPTTRIEAFSDGVFAIVITLLAFQFNAPHLTRGVGIEQNFNELLKVYPNFISLVFGFLYVSVFWVNHHQLFHSIKEADRKLLWHNIHLLFWITLVPFTTGMVGDYPKIPLSAIALASVLLMVSVSSYIVRRYSYSHAAMINEHSSAQIIKSGLSRNLIAIVLNLAAIGIAFVNVMLSYIVFTIVLTMFIIPLKTEIIKESHHQKK